MSVWENFSKWVKAEVKDLNLEGMYNNIEAERQYDRAKLQRVVNLCLYHAELSGKKECCGTLAHFASLLKDEDRLMALEELLFLVAFCDKSLQSSFSNKLYI